MSARTLFRLSAAAAFGCYGFSLHAETTVSGPSALGRVEVVADLPKQGPYVGEPVMLHIRSYVHGNVALDQIIQPILTNFNWQQFGIDESNYAMVDGIRTAVLERTIMVTPVLAGLLTIPPMVRHVTMINENNERIEVDFASEPLVINVKAHDGVGHQGDWWLPAKSVKITDSWDPAPDHIPFGETALRTVTIEAAGITADQLPSPPLLRAPGVISFAGPTERQTIVTDDGPLARAIYRWRLRPISATASTVPELHIPWFDITTRQMREATVPEREVAFLDSEHDAQTSPRAVNVLNLVSARPLAASAAAFLWSLSILYLIANAGTGTQIWKGFFLPVPRAIKALKRAARDNDVRAFRRALDELARSHREAWVSISRESGIAAGLAEVNASLFAASTRAEPLALGPLAAAIGRAWRELPVAERVSSA